MATAREPSSMVEYYRLYSGMIDCVSIRDEMFIQYGLWEFTLVLQQEYKIPTLSSTECILVIWANTESLGVFIDPNDGGGDIMINLVVRMTVCCPII